MESENILNLAKRNYQYYLKKNIETYFDKRIKLGEYVQKYSENLRGIINSLSLGFINDLYKTVGVVLGAIIAALLAKDNTIFVIRLTSLLYFIYLVFVLLLTILSTIYQYSLKNQDYQNDLANLKAIMLKDEIDSLSKHAINRWKIYFSIVSIFVFSAYFILGYLAIKIFLLMS